MVTKETNKLTVTSENMKNDGWEQTADDPKVWVKGNIAIDSEDTDNLIIDFEIGSALESLFNKLGLINIGNVTSLN